MEKNTKFKFRALCQCCVLAALMCSASVAKACDLDVAHIIKENVVFPNTAFFDLRSGQATLAEMRLTVHNRAKKNGRAYTKDDKRVRFVSGVALAIENLTNLKNEKTRIGFYAEDKTFVGYLRLSPDSKKHSSGSVVKVSNINGRAADILLKYDSPRLLSDALEDAVCIYQALPRMMEKAGA